MNSMAGREVLLGTQPSEDSRSIDGRDAAQAAARNAFTRSIVTGTGRHTVLHTGE